MKMGVILASSAVAGGQLGPCAAVVGCLRCRPVQLLPEGNEVSDAEGERKVEDLAIGDLLPTMLGGLRPVHRIGHYPFQKNDPSKPWVKDALPVLIVRSAFAPNVPHANLNVTASHSL